MPTIARRIRFYSRRVAHTILQSRGTPQQIAGGAAFGTFASFNPTVGSQAIVAVALAAIFRCSKLPAIAMTFLSNPLTAVPMYSAAYMVGVWFVRLFGFETAKWHNVKSIFMKADETGFWNIVREKSAEIASLGWRAIVPMEIGATVVGALAGLLTYYVTLRLVTGHRLLKAERAMRRAQRRLERVRLEQAADRAGDGEPST